MQPRLPDMKVTGALLNMASPFPMVALLQHSIEAGLEDPVN